MGVDGIWAECKAVVRTVSLTDWAIEQSRLNGRPTVVGIDTPNMIDKILASSGVHERMHGDGAIGSLISSILQYTEVPATFVFAFDADSGGDISHKAGKKVVNKKIPFYNTARRFIKSIGGHIVNGPGEADIQLAMLSQQGYVDAVISDDGDMIVHNIGHVLRYNKKKSKNCGRIFVDEYCASDVQRHLQLRSPADLLLIAVLVGNSYDRTGLKGCGMKTALELARCGLGEVLVGKFKAAQSPGLVRLEGWKAGLKFELETNSSRKLSGRNRALASRVQSFDPRAALSAYLKAIRLPTFIRINSRNGHPNQSILKAYNYIQEGISFDRLDKKENPGTPRILTLNEVHIHSVRDFCITYMHWDCAKILQYFARKVWAGVIIQMLHSPFLVCDGLDNGSPRMPKSIHTPWHKVRLLSFPNRRKQEKYPGSTIPHIRITFGIDSLVAKLKTGQNPLAFDDNCTPMQLDVRVPVECMRWMDTTAGPSSISQAEIEPLAEILSASISDDGNESDAMEIEEEITYLYTRKHGANYITVE